MLTRVGQHMLLLIKFQDRWKHWDVILDWNPFADVSGFLTLVSFVHWKGGGGFVVQSVSLKISRRNRFGTQRWTGRASRAPCSQYRNVWRAKTGRDHKLRKKEPKGLDTIMMSSVYKISAMSEGIRADVFPVALRAVPKDCWRGLGLPVFVERLKGS